MPILQSIPDPRAQIVMDYITRLQQERVRQEIEREKSRQEKKKRVAVGVGLAAGALGGFLVAPAAIASSAATGAGVTAAGTSALAGQLGSAFIGANIGAQAGQSFVNNDYAGGIGSAIQGAATIASLPALQAQGISAVEVAAAGPQELPRLLQAAQIGRRQTENIIRYDAQRRQAESQQFQQLPPGPQSQVAQLRQSITDLAIQAQRQQITQEEFGSMSQPALEEIDVIMEANKPQPRPTLQQRFDSGQGFAFDGNTNMLLIEQPDGKVTARPYKAPFTQQEKAESFSARKEELLLDFYDEEVARFEVREAELNSQRSFFSRLSEEDMAKRAKAKVDASASLKVVRTRRAAEQARQDTDAKFPDTRVPWLKPTAEESKQQQESQQQQQAQQVQQQVNQEKQQQVQQAFVTLNRARNFLQEFARDRKLPADPAKWSAADREDASQAAIAISTSLAQLAPMMGEEDKLEVQRLNELVIAILKLPISLDKGQ